jgi:hypothetical protein
MCDAKCDVFLFNSKSDKKKTLAYCAEDDSLCALSSFDPLNRKNTLYFQFQNCHLTFTLPQFENVGRSYS